MNYQEEIIKRIIMYFDGAITALELIMYISSVLYEIELSQMKGIL